MLKAITNKTLFGAIAVVAITLSGCNSQQRQAEKQDKQIRQRVEQLKKKHNAYPVNGSNTDHYIP